MINEEYHNARCRLPDKKETKARGVSTFHWYKQTSEECPVCGKRYEYRERIYGKKPDNLKEIYFHKQIYDHCTERAC